MSAIAAFRPWLYDFARTTGAESVLAPPYDVISAEDAAAMAASSPHHVIHLILGKPAPGTSFGDESYSRAASLWSEWRRDGVLRREPKPALYTYDVEFADLVTGERIARRGVAGALLLAPFEDRIVLPHEEVFPGPLSDRAKLMAATDAALSPLFAIYDDPADRVRRALGGAPAEPVIDQTDQDGVRHTLRRVTDPDALAAACDALGDGPVIMADGHHRYTAALAHAEKRGRLGNPTSPAYTLGCLTRSQDPGLRAYGTHRLFRCEGAEPDIQRLASFARITPVPLAVGRTLLGELAPGPDGSSRPVYVFVTRAGAFRVEVEDAEAAGRLLDRIHPVLRTQPLVLLHEVLIRRGLGLSDGQIDAAGGVSHTRDADDALAALRSGRSDLAVLVQAPSGREVAEVCAAGQRMPHKATFFYPKLLSGCLFLAFGDVGIPVA